MSEHLLTKFDNTIANILKTAQLAKIYDSENLMNEKQSTEVAKGVYETKVKLLKSSMAIASSKNSSTVKEFEDNYNDIINKNTTSLKGEIKQTTDEIRKIFFVTNDSQSPSQLESNQTLDFIMEENEENYIDPITKCRINNPVRNKICGHLYEKSSILELIKINKKVRCPVSGCGNKQRVTDEDIFIDEKIAKILQTQPPPQ